MIINLTASICFIIVMLILIIDFNSKEKIKNMDNTCFRYLSFLTVIGLLLECLTYFLILKDYKVDSILLLFLGRLIFIYYNIFMYFFVMYVFSACFRKNENNHLVKKFVIFETVIYIFFVILVLFLPFSYADSETYLYPIGMATDFSYIVGGIAILFVLVLSIIKFKTLKLKRSLSIFIAIFLAVISVLLQMKYHNLLLLIPSHAIALLIMYFTIENPDLKLISELNIAKDQAEKANNAKTDFLSNMSHEIRTPLNAIVGFSEALLDEELSENARSEVNDIISASQSLLEIVNGILDISKIEANKLEIINSEYQIKKIFNDLIALTRVRIGEKPIEFRIKIDSSIPPVLYGDYTRLKQIILNLLTNAAKYTKEGYIDFKVNSVKKEGICRLIISIEDTGIGIKKENIDKLFTKFERFEEKNTTTEGTGLGLAITKKLVELMRGKIVVQSVYGQGSRFTVAIDQRIVDKNPEEVENSITILEDLNLNDKRVLVVDDNLINIKVAIRLLKNYNLRTDQVTSGQDCIDKIKAGEKYDLILLDDMMPKMSGVATLKNLKADPNFKIPTVALTANAIAGMKEKYLVEGFDDYLAKPIEKIELYRVINKFLNKK